MWRGRGYANHRMPAPTRMAVMLGAQTPPFVAYVDMKEDIALAVWPGRNTSPMVKESPWGGRGRGEALRGGDQGSTFDGGSLEAGPGLW